MNFTDEQLNKWKREINPAPIAKSRIPTLHRENAEWVGCCPDVYHKKSVGHSDKHPSLKFWKQDDGTWTFKCFSCQTRGNIFQLVQACDKVSFTKAVELVLAQAGVTGWENGQVQEGASIPETAPKKLVTFPMADYLQAEDALMKSAPGRKWLTDRGIHYSTAKKLHLGFMQSCKAISSNHPWMEKGWILFPTISADGKTVVSIKYRSLVGKHEMVDDKAVSGILRAPNTATVLYNLQTVSSDDDVFIVEGEPDVAVLEQISIPCVGYPSSGYAPTEDECEQLKKAKRRFLAGDSDKPGQAAIDALGKKVPESTYIIHWPKGRKDANDVLLNECQGDAVKFGILVAQLKAKALEHPLTAEAVIRDGDKIVPKSILWMWRDRVPFGKVSLFAGNPDNGKSLSAASLAAIVTTGRPFPGEDISHKPGDVLLLIGEDDLDDTAVPRLMAAGAEMSRIHFMESIRTPNGDESEIRLDAHMPLIEKQLVANPNIQLVILDPISNYLGDVSMVAEQEVRSVLVPLKRLAGKYGVAIVLVMHLNKKNELEAISRVGGAMAFIGVSRCSWLFVRDTVDADEEELAKTPDTFSMLRIKNNLARADKNGLAYTVKVARVTIPGEGEDLVPYIEWGGNVSRSADDALGSRAGSPRKAEIGGPSGKLQKAMRWLENALQDGPRPRNELVAAAKDEEHISEDTLYDAKTQLKVVMEKAGPGRKAVSMWSLPIANATKETVSADMEPHQTPLAMDDGEPL